MKRMLLFAGLALAAPALVFAQGQRSAFVVTLGNDTVAVERYTRSATSLEGDVINRMPRTRVVHYVATLDGNRVRSMEMSMRQPPATTNALSGTIDFGKDTATVTVHLGDSVNTIRMPVQPQSLPVLNNSFGLVEQRIVLALASGADSVALDLVPIGPRTPLATYVARRGRDSVVVDYFGLPGLARIDQNGRLLEYDGRETTVKVMAHRVADVDIEGLLARYAAMDANGQAMGQASSRDTVRATVGDAHITIDYGRPLRRGRAIFGNIVPYNQVWRTGANAATQFTTDKTITVGGVELTPATYTLWTLPTASGAKLIINKQFGQWGTDYDVAQDLARVDVLSTNVADPMEKFTIVVLPEGTNGKLLLTWDRTQYAVPIVGH